MRSLTVTFTAFALGNTVFAFHVLPRRSRNQFATISKIFGDRYGGNGQDIVPAANNPFRDVNLDLEKAQDCANHFGKYPVKEIEKLRDDLHAHRIKKMAFGDSAAPEDVLFQERFLEDELTLQLHLLKEELPDPYLFPQVVAKPDHEMEELPHLRDGMAAAVKLEEGKKIEMVEEWMEEGVLESLAICGLIGLLMVAPQVLW